MAALLASAVDQPAVRRARRFHHGLRERGVAVDHARHLGEAALQRARVDELLHELGRAAADDVAAEQLAIAGLADDLDEAGAVAVDGAPADGSVGNLAHYHLVALLARLGLGQPKRAHVRLAEGRARHVHERERVRLLPGRVLYGDDALIGRLVRERGPGHQIADRIDPLARGALGAVDAYQAPLVELDARVGQPE